MYIEQSDFKAEISAFIIFSKNKLTKERKEKTNKKKYKSEKRKRKRKELCKENYKKFIASLLHWADVKRFSDFTDIKGSTC